MPRAARKNPRKRPKKKTKLKVWKSAATAAPEDVSLYSELVLHALQMRREEAAREEEEDERIARDLAEQFEREDEERQRQEEEDERLARELAGGGRNVRRRTG